MYKSRGFALLATNYVHSFSSLLRQQPRRVDDEGLVPAFGIVLDVLPPEVEGVA